MAEELITFNINIYGEPTITTSGFTGQACAKATEPFEKLLTDGAGANRTWLPEASFSNSNSQQQQQQQSW